MGDPRDMVEVERMDGSDLAKRVTCKACKEVIYEIAVGATQTQIDIEITGLRAHFEFRHQMAIELVRCNDPRCLGKH